VSLKAFFLLGEGCTLWESKTALKEVTP